MRRKHPPRHARNTFDVPSDLSKEVWKLYHSGTVDYEISNYGRVRRYLRPFFVGKSKYTQVYMSGDRRMFVHELVAHCFIGERPAGLVINHKDGNGMNNWYENLEYVTQAENCRHAVRIGKHKYYAGERSTRSYVSDMQRQNIVALLQKGATRKQVAKLLEVPLGSVSWTWWCYKHSTGIFAKKEPNT